MTATRGRGRRYARPSGGEVTGRSGAPRSAQGTAKDRALRLLGVRWRSREELRRRLGQAGFDAADVEGALEDLERAGLVDDDRFAGELARDQATRRLAGARAVRAALRERGVAPEVVERTIAELEAGPAGSDEDRARALAERQARRLLGLGSEAAARRLLGVLIRRGFSSDVARRVTRDALAEAYHEAGEWPVD